MKSWLGLFLLLPAFASAAPTIQMRMEVTPREAYIGDVIEGRVIVTCASDVLPIPIDVPKTLGAFEVRFWTALPFKEEKTGERLAETKFELMTFSTGTQTIPSLLLRFKSSDQVVSEAKTDEVPITIKSMLQEKGDEGRLRPLKGTFNYRSWLWLWILLGIFAGAGLIYFFWRQRQTKNGLVKPVGPVKKPEEIAWEELQKLEASDWIEQGKVKEFYSKLSDILRSYIEGRYQMAALERTTSELLIDLRSLNLLNELTAPTRVFLETADLVKFAKFAPDGEEIRFDLLRVKAFVSNTTPNVAPVNGEKSQAEEISI